ncbi:MAG: hypothetical protein MRY63_12155 [Neomegalonema sp.]|nr:hypothetical protein [Neomegalonema sp.]
MAICGNYGSLPPTSSLVRDKFDFILLDGFKIMPAEISDQDLSTIIDIFRESGFNGGVMEKIAKGTSLRSKRRLYDFFDGKEAVYLAALRTYSERRHNDHQKICARKKTVKERFRLIFEREIEKEYRYGCLLCYAMVERAPHDEAVRAITQSADAQLQGTFASLLGEDNRWKDDAELRAQQADTFAMLFSGFLLLIPQGTSKAELATRIEQILALLD